MKVDGRIIAEGILETLRHKVTGFKKQGITPTMAVILVGDDPGSLSYIAQKKRAAESIGAKLLFEQLPASTSAEALDSTITHYNNDPTVHGLIIQRPVPVAGVGHILATVAPAKDVDGFIANSPYQVPVARAVLTILTYIHAQLQEKNLVKQDFLAWLGSQSIAVVGRGETAGRPIATVLTSYGCTPSVIHSQTPNPEHILKGASIIISCTGKSRVIRKSNIEPGVILIAVGLFRGKDGKLHGDYEEEEVKNIASFYTPTPGGVGPVNVAALMQNLIDACILQVSV